MTTTIVYGNPNDGAVGSGNTVYATARAGATLTADTSGATLYVFVSSLGTIGVGQGTLGAWFLVGEAFIAFDLASASLPPEDQITDAELVLNQRQSNGSTAYTVEVREHDWGTSLSTADWVSGVNLGDLPLLASVPASAGSDVDRNFASSGSALIDHVESHRAGVSRMLLCSSRHRVGDQPSGQEHTWFWSGNHTAHRPRLIIEHEPAAASPIEAYDGTTWEPLELEMFDGTTWHPLALEPVE